MTELEALRAFAESMRSLPTKAKMADALKVLDETPPDLALPAQPVIDDPVRDELPQITCPRCGTVDLPLVRVRTFAVCGYCGTSLLIEHDRARPAILADLEQLGAAEMATLKRARGSIVRAERRQR